MRFAGFLMVVAVAVGLAPAGAQIQIPSAPPSSVAAKPAAGTVGGERPPVALQTLTVLEKDIDGRLATTGEDDPCVVLGDRKSTRLNSSHLGISYAVFCL